MAARRTRVVLFTLLIFAGLGGALYYFGPRAGGLVNPGPLAEVHAHIDNDASCSLCHVRGTGITGGLLAPAQLCLDCHQPLAGRLDVMKGFHAQVPREECKTCHTEHLGRDHALITWPDPEEPFAATSGTFDPKQFPHDKGAGWPLEGAHAKLACDACHTRALVSDPLLVKWEAEKHAEASKTPDWAKGLESYLGTSAQCSSCHQDAHVPSQGDDCASCHGLEKWKPAKDFVHAPPRTRYALEGKHKEVACEKCHLAKAPAAPQVVAREGLPDFKQVVASGAPVPYSKTGWGKGEFAIPSGKDLLPDTCKVCHANPHRAGSEDFLRCEDCHTEADWKTMVPGRFDHARAAESGFALVDGHQKPTCTDCHGRKEGDKVLHLPARERCVECHQKDDDRSHKGAFAREIALEPAENCALCHGIKAWKPADRWDPRTHGDPQGPALPLIDGHMIRCEDCHGTQGVQQACALVQADPGKRPCTRTPAAGEGFTRLPAQAPAPVGPLEKSCTGCHFDPHDGRLTQRPETTCVSCHDFKAWNLAKLDQQGHAEVGFPIRGAHVKVFDDCGKCHGGTLPGGGLRQVSLSNVKTDGCYACHQKDDDQKGHVGQLGKSCNSCHTEESWAPSTYGIERHQKARFQLVNAHAATPCAECHVADVPAKVGPDEPPAKLPRYQWGDRSQPLRCVTCHQATGKEVHGAQFRGQDCNQCHDDRAWSPSSFDQARHEKVAKFAITGAHDVACSRCHQPMGGGKVVKWQDVPTQCAGCHVDPHAGQFAGRWGDGCSGCHSIAAWIPSTFDHEKARFPLRGAHAALECKACHYEIQRNVGGETRGIAHYYPIEKRACDDCHQNPHSTETPR